MYSIDPSVRKALTNYKYTPFAKFNRTFQQKREIAKEKRISSQSTAIDKEIFSNPASRMMFSFYFSLKNLFNSIVNNDDKLSSYLQQITRQPNNYIKRHANQDKHFDKDPNKVISETIDHTIQDFCDENKLEEREIIQKTLDLIKNQNEDYNVIKTILEEKLSLLDESENDNL